MLTEDKGLVASFKGAESVITGGGGRASSRAKPASTTAPSHVDLEIAVYIQYIINNPDTKDPLLIWAPSCTTWTSHTAKNSQAIVCYKCMFI